MFLADIDRSRPMDMSPINAKLSLKRALCFKNFDAILEFRKKTYWKVLALIRITSIKHDFKDVIFVTMISQIISLPILSNSGFALVAAGARSKESCVHVLSVIMGPAAKNERRKLYDIMPSPSLGRRNFSKYSYCARISLTTKTRILWAASCKTTPILAFRIHYIIYLVIIIL